MSHNPSVVDTLARSTIECWKTFEIFSSALQQFSEKASLDFSARDADDIFEQFKVLVANVGAGAEGKLSLDYRLRDSETTKKAVLVILRGLTSNLNHCIDVMKGNRLPVSLRSDSESSEDDKDVVPQEELNERFSDAADAVEQLAKLLIAIRAASRQQGRDFRAAAFEDWQDGINMSAQFEAYVKQILLHRPDTQNLQVRLRERLARGIAQRRRQFAYQQRHQKKIYGAGGLPLSPANQIKSTTPVSSAHKTVDGNTSSLPPSQPQRQTQGATCPTLLSETVASAFQEDRLAVSSGSSAITSSSAASSSGQCHDFPPPPNAAGQNGYVTCPYCYQLLSNRTLKRRNWRRHVIADLRPYICIFDDCATEARLFETEEEWLEHERWSHNLSWSCDGFEHAPKTFPDAASFTEHMKVVHPETAKLISLNRLAELNVKPPDTVFPQSPFCSHPQPSSSGALCLLDPRPSVPMEKHILCHLTDLFLIALPYHDNFKGKSSINSKSQTFARSVQDVVGPDDEVVLTDYDVHSSKVNHDRDVPDTDNESWEFVPPTPYSGPESDPKLATFIARLSYNDFRPRRDPEREEQLLARLPYAKNAAFNHYDRQGDSLCMPNTRTEVLREIMAWTCGEPSSEIDNGGGSDGRQQKRVYWLSGMAGTGKSTIARTVARRCHEEGRLGASFFFSRGGGELETARRFVTTIAVQLARKFSMLKTHICDAIAANPDITAETLSDQWKALVLRPCEKWGASDVPKSSLVVVIDALNECNDKREIEFVLQLLSESPGLLVSRLLIFLTSRPEILIRQGIYNIPEAWRRHLALHHIDPELVDHDIRVFFENKLGMMLQRRNSQSVIAGKAILQQLVEKAGGLFIWASTTCLFVTSGLNPTKRLHLILNDGAPPTNAHPQKQLDRIYHSVLQNALREDNSSEEEQEFCSVLRTVLGTVAVLFSALSATSLASLLYLSEHHLLEALSNLHSILNVPDKSQKPIRPQHASVRDFLLDQQRCTDRRFWVNGHEAHTHIAHQCLRLLNDNLKRDMCGLNEPGALVKDVSRAQVDASIPLQLRYACLYWVQHVEHSQNTQTLEKPIHKLLKKHFLHWLEALSLVRRLADSVEMVTTLESLYDTDSGLRVMLADAKRFLLYNRRMIEEAPLQTYCSAIAFAPAKSIIRKIFSEQLPRWLCQTPMVRESWSRELQSLEGHTGEVRAVAFSPDGQLLASASEDKTVRLWDVKTGAACGTLEGHTHWVTAVAFLPDGQLLASASYDYTVRLWDVKTGAACGTLEGHRSWAACLGISPDDPIDSTVGFWDVKSGPVWGTFEDHRSWANAVALSPDGQLLASESWDDTVRLWDVKSGAACGTLKCHTGWVTAMAFSSDGQLLASASNNSPFMLWDVKTGTACGTLEYPTFGVTAVAFSPDGQLLASASWDKTVCLWGVATGAAYGTLEGHTDSVMDVAFSPDGQLLASASEDKTVRLWDVKTGAASGIFEGHTDMVAAVAFSPDGQLLASASNDKTVRLWDVNMGAACGTRTDHTKKVRAAAFSPDNQFLASASDDGTVKLWAVASGEVIRTLGKHSQSVTAVAFSPNGKILASASLDKTIQLWNVEEGVACGTFDNHSYTSWLNFSTDGTYIETSAGQIALNVAPSSVPAADAQPITAGTISIKGRWLTFNSKNLLFIPLEYRPDTVASRGNMIAMGLPSGRVIFLAFNFQDGPIGE